MKKIEIEDLSKIFIDRTKVDCNSLEILIRMKVHIQENRFDGG